MNKKEWKSAWRQARLPSEYGITGAVIPIEVRIKDDNLIHNVRIAQKLLSRRFVLDGHLAGGIIQMRLSAYKCKKAYQDKVANQQTYLNKYHADCIF